MRAPGFAGGLSWFLASMVTRLNYMHMLMVKSQLLGALQTPKLTV
jgi:hypothetical protein